MILIKTKFETFYDKYSPMAFDIALQFSPNEKHAEEILNVAFTKAYHQNIEEQSFPPPCISLLKILIETAERLLNFKMEKNNFRLRQFENFPILQSLLCKKESLAIHCINNNITKEQASINLRTEFLRLRNLQGENNLNDS